MVLECSKIIVITLTQGIYFVCLLTHIGLLMNGMYTWFGFSSGMTLVDLGSIQRHFDKLFNTMPVSNPIMRDRQDVEFD